MAKTRGTGLLMAWTDVDPAHEAEFNRWYDEEHIHRLLAVPGFLSAARYRALRGGAMMSRAPVITSTGHVVAAAAARPSA